MASALKNLYSIGFYNNLTKAVAEAIPGFNKKEFISEIFTDEFEAMELKQRMRHTTVVLNKFLPGDYKASVRIILEIVKRLQQNGVSADGLAYMFIPDYIEVFGIDHYDESIPALEVITQFVSCEFAVRPFMLRYEDRMIEQMKAWSLHANHKVRRFASEGSRPRLPWAMAIPSLKKDPTAILPILENLKNDPSEWVRRSVANNLNDIAKDHPAIILSIAKKWKGISKETDAIIKHGSRTLLKQGHPEILKHYNLRSINIQLTDFEILNPIVKIGDSIEFSFVVTNQNPTSQIVRLEYGLYYRKANGQLTRKVFKISEKIFEAGVSAKIIRKQSFRLITTRTFYLGEHELSIILNGEEKGVKKFVLSSAM